MSVSTSLYVLLWCAFIFKPTSTGTCSEHRQFGLKFSNLVPYEKPSVERNLTSVAECATLCERFHSENCTAFFYNTNTRSCSIYNPSLICLTLGDQPGTKGYVYDNNPVTACREKLFYPHNYYDSDWWLVIQRRTDGSEDFDRSWVEYENGFGNATNEFWLGNTYIHELTTQRTCELQIDLEALNGSKGYIRYSQFSIAGADDKYRLSIGNKLAGNLPEKFNWHNGKNFSTKDNDTSYNCAKINAGGWWYACCGYAFLNGRPPCDKLYCNNWSEFGSKLNITQMKIRPALCKT